MLNQVVLLRNAMPKSQLLQYKNQHPVAKKNLHPVAEKNPHPVAEKNLSPLAER